LLPSQLKGSPLSQEIVYNLEKRKKKLLGSKAILNAIFLDPRQMFELTVTERTSIKKDLIAIHKRIKGWYYSLIFSISFNCHFYNFPFLRNINVGG